MHWSWRAPPTGPYPPESASPDPAASATTARARRHPRYATPQRAYAGGSAQLCSSLLRYGPIPTNDQPFPQIGQDLGEGLLQGALRTDHELLDTRQKVALAIPLTHHVR